MAAETTYARLKTHLDSVFDRVSDDREVVIVRRRNGRDVALVAAAELSSLIETAHLLQSPANARRLLAASRRAARGGGKSMSVSELRWKTIAL